MSFSSFYTILYVFIFNQSRFCQLTMQFHHHSLPFLYTASPSVVTVFSQYPVLYISVVYISVHLQFLFHSSMLIQLLYRSRCYIFATGTHVFSSSITTPYPFSNHVCLSVQYSSSTMHNTVLIYH